MKIYKNPDGANLDVLYPTLFFASIGSIFFLLLKTCISMDQFWSIALGALVGSYLLFCFVQKKKQENENVYAKLFLASTGTPLLVALTLALNYFISFEMFRTKTELEGNIKFSNYSMYIAHDNAPQLCSKLYKITDTKGIYKYNFIETKINKGILGFPVLKYHKLTVD